MCIRYLFNHSSPGLADLAVSDFRPVALHGLDRALVQIRAAAAAALRCSGTTSLDTPLLEYLSRVLDTCLKNHKSKETFTIRRDMFMDLLNQNHVQASEAFLNGNAKRAKSIVRSVESSLDLMLELNARICFSPTSKQPAENLRYDFEVLSKTIEAAQAIE